jgi:hypothetical protein
MVLAQKLPGLTSTRICSPALDEARQVAIAKGVDHDEIIGRCGPRLARYDSGLRRGQRRACVTGTLASYEALGTTGYTIGNVTFFDFGWTPTETGGASAPPATIETACVSACKFDP